MSMFDIGGLHLRRTNISVTDIERLLRLLFVVALALVAISAVVSPSQPLSPVGLITVVTLTLANVLLAVSTQRGDWKGHGILLSFVDLISAGSMYLATGGNARVLLYFLVALAATRLLLENALVIATIGSAFFSLHLLVPADNPIFLSNLYIFAADLLSTYAVVFIVHFAVTGQREAQVRRAQARALSDAQRLLDQQQMLVRLSREMADATSLELALQIVLGTLRRFIPFTGGSIALIDVQQRLYIAAAVPSVDEAVRALRLPIGEGITGWIAEHQEPFSSGDLDSETRVPPLFRDIGSNARLKSYSGVPLITRGHCIGVLEVDSREANAFTPEHQDLLSTVAAQASGAIENARLLEERREFSRRLELVYVAANELTSHFDLDFILQEFARRASQVLQARFAAAATLNEHRQIDKFVTYGLTEEERQEIGELPKGLGLMRQVLAEEKPIRIDDMSTHSASVGFPLNHPAMRSLLAAPLISRGEQQGAIYLSERQDGQPFTAEDEELLLLLASGASAAISNARLYVQLRRNIEQLYALHQIGQAIGSSLSQDEVIRVFNFDVRRLCGAEASVISEWSAARNEPVELNREGPPDLLDHRARPLVERQLKEAGRKGQAMSLTFPSAGNDGPSLYGYIAPLTVRGKVIGVAEIYARESIVISPESSSLFLTLAAQLAVSIENARLYSQLQKREHQLRNFVGRLFQAEDAERRRLAYDIHDGLAQLIVSADMHMNNFASLRREGDEQAELELQKGFQGLKASLGEARRVVSELRPSTLDDFGLVNTLRRHIEQLAADQGWEYSFDENLGEQRLEPALETGVFRIVQESLNNIRKYSATRRVEVELKLVGDELNVRIQDWGHGFDLEQARHLEGHFGLSSMEERARLLGGWFEIDTKQGQGTTILVGLPSYRAVAAVQA